MKVQWIPTREPMQRETKIPTNSLRRRPKNPLITPRDLPFACCDIHNAGVTKVDGRYVLLLTVENLQGNYRLYRATSRDGEEFEFDSRPFLPVPPDAEYEGMGTRDPRITRLDGTYHIVYVAESRFGTRLGLAESPGMRTARRVGYISEPDTKNGMLFPEKIGGRYARLERPKEGDSIWVSFSHDLNQWGGWRRVMAPRPGYWDPDRIGGAAPPMRIDEGWLLLYYGEKHTSAGPIFRLGAAILDPDDPWRIVGRTNVPVLSPVRAYERVGDVGNLVFSCGALLREDEPALEVFYGASASCICAGDITLSQIEKACLKRKVEA